MAIYFTYIFKYILSELIIRDYYLYLITDKTFIYFSLITLHH